MLGFGVKFAGEGQPMAGQNERAFPVIIQYVDDKSYVVWPKSQAQREPVLPLPGGHDLLQHSRRGRVAEAARAGRRRAGQAFRRLHRRQQRVVQGRSGRDPRPDRPQRLGQEHDLQHAVGHVPADGGIDPLRGPGDRGPRRRTASSTAASAAPSRSRGRSGGSSIFENVALAGYFGQDAPQPRQGRRGGASERSPWSACRPIATRSVDGLGAAGLKKLELAKALATGPKLLLADESLGGLDEQGDGPGRRHAAQDPRRARHHHHLGRAHHGRADARGRPRHGARPRREDRRGPAERRCRAIRA